jgi:hypothetical protein
MRKTGGLTPAARRSVCNDGEYTLLPGFADLLQAKR